MDPFGHHHNKHHHRRDDRDDEDYPPPPNFPQPPPPFSGGGGGYRDEPPPPFSGGGGGYRDEPPPPFSGGGGYRDDPPPPFSGPGGGGYRDEFQQSQPPFSGIGGGYRDEPPPPFSGGGGYRDDPPPPPFSGVTGHHHTPPPPHSNYGGGEYNPPPPPQPHRSEYAHSTPAHPPAVQHVSHEIHHRPQPHEGGGGGGNALPNNKPTVRVYSKAETNYSLTIRDGQVILARSDPRDDFQHWIKDEKWSTKVKDKEGHPCFSLINKATGEALKHSAGETYPVQLTPYVPNKFDESILWSFSKDLGDTYNTIRMVNNIKLNLDALNGDQNHGGVHDGTKAVLWEWKKGDNQRWKIVPYW